MIDNSLLDELRSFFCKHIRGVLRDQGHDVVGEPTHVFGKNEAHMAKRVLLVEDDLIFDLFV